MKKSASITVEFLKEQFKNYDDRQKSIKAEVNNLSILYNKLEGAKENILILLEELENESKEVDKKSNDTDTK